MVLKIATAIIAIADTIKLVKDVIDTILRLTIDKNISTSREQRNDYEKNRAILIKKMLEAENDEERIALSIAIHNVNTGKQLRQ